MSDVSRYALFRSNCRFSSSFRMCVIPYLRYPVHISPTCIGFPVNVFPLPRSPNSLIGIFAWRFPLEARYVRFGLSRSIIGHLAYLISFLCSRRYLAESFHASSISSCCGCFCRRLISCSLFAISCCRVLLFLCAYSSSSISFCVPHFPSFSVHSCSFVIFPFY